MVPIYNVGEMNCPSYENDVRTAYLNDVFGSKTRMVAFLNSRIK
jgi:hypothetical protein